MKKAVVSFLVTICLIATVFSTVMADETGYFNVNGQGYQWNFDSDTGLLTVDAVYSTSGRNNSYGSISSEVTDLVINGIHDSHDTNAGYSYSEIYNNMTKVKTITVNSSCSEFNKLYCCPELQKITFNNNKAESTTLNFINSKAKSFPEIVYDKNNKSTYFLNFNSFNGLSVLTVPASYGKDSHITYSFSESTVDSVSFESGTKTIPEYAFDSCRDLNKVTIPSGVTTIDNCAFYGCRQLTSISIPASVKTIRYNSFVKSSVNTINYAGTRDQWSKAVKPLASGEGGNILYLDNATVHCSDGDYLIRKKSAGDHYEYEQIPLGWYQADGKWYYSDQEGNRAVDCLKDLDGATYHFDSKGVMSTGWAEVDGSWRFFDIRNGQMQKSRWVYDYGQWYYFDSEGKMYTGWNQLGKTWYYFKETGSMVTGWMEIDNAWYYFDSNGAMVTGWYQIGSAWYLFEKNGKMQTGWQKAGNSWYFYKESGEMVTGWMEINKVWYYFQDSGTMVTGWRKINGSWYYFLENGSMVAGKTMTIDGKDYIFDSTGRWIED